MAASDVRNILLRAMFEPEYHAQLTSNPEKALQGYNLTDQEKSALTKPSAELYRFLQPGEEPQPASLYQGSLIVAVIVVVSIVASVITIAPMGPGAVDVAKFGPLLSAIKMSSGPARFDLVKTLINELTRG